jgi:hypothetical protein
VDSKTLLLSSDSSICGEILDKRHIQAIQSLWDIPSVEFQHFAVLSAGNAEGIMMWSNIYGSIEQLNLIDRVHKWDITLQQPHHCDRDVEYRNPHSWPLFGSDGNTVRTSGLERILPSIDETLADAIWSQSGPK